MARLRSKEMTEEDKDVLFTRILLMQRNLDSPTNNNVFSVLVEDGIAFVVARYDAIHVTAYYKKTRYRMCGLPMAAANYIINLNADVETIKEG